MNSPSFRKKYLLYCGISLLATLLLCFLWKPVYLSLASDAVCQGWLITAVLYYVSTIWEELIFSVLTVLLATGEYFFFHARKPRILSKVFVICVAFVKYLCNLIATAIEAGNLDFTSDDFLSLGLSFLLDCLILLVVFLISRSICRKHFENAAILEKAYRLADKGEYDERAEVYPFRKWVMPKAPILGGVFWGVLLSAVFKILSALYYDLFFWGFPETAEDAAQMAQQYIGILILGVISYLFAYLLSSILFRNKKT